MHKWLCYGLEASSSGTCRVGSGSGGSGVVAVGHPSLCGLPTSMLVTIFSFLTPTDLVCSYRCSRLLSIVVKGYIPTVRNVVFPIVPHTQVHQSAAVLFFERHLTKAVLLDVRTPWPGGCGVS